jgi:hypothetical protein
MQLWGCVLAGGLWPPVAWGCRVGPEFVCILDSADYLHRPSRFPADVCTFSSFVIQRVKSQTIHPFPFAVPDVIHPITSAIFPHWCLTQQRQFIETIPLPPSRSAPILASPNCPHRVSLRRQTAPLPKRRHL